MPVHGSSQIKILSSNPQPPTEPPNQRNKQKTQEYWKGRDGSRVPQIDTVAVQLWSGVLREWQPTACE
eukprot:3270360-Amphidinium_carterae.1